MFKTAFKYICQRQIVAKSIDDSLVNVDLLYVTAINGQAHATTRDALDGNALVV